MIIGIDTGGTFTDFIVYDQGKIFNHKQLSTPHAPEEAILAGLKALSLNLSESSTAKIIHGTTVATNAALEGKGVRTAYVTNQGFADVLSIGRQNRSKLYDLCPEGAKPPVPEKLCFELNTRVDANGKSLISVDPNELDALKKTLKEQHVDAVAINFLFSYLNSDDEKRVADALANDFFVSSSHDVAPIQQEYERGMACWLNSWLSPKVKDYIQRLETALRPTPLYIMQSNGGITTASNAANRAVNLLLSGPAGGLAAAEAVAKQTGLSQLLTFDMGGTSTDVALIENTMALTQSGSIGSFPVAVPMIDMITIGAGGGSLAKVDDAGMLHVGPESAGASPGPACYGQGGQRATVTDANLLLERIPSDTLLGGDMPLNASAATEAIATLASQLGCDINAAAEGIIKLANEHMIQALRRISIERGHNASEFALCCFGGAGGLHICALADGLAIKKAVVPNYSGLLSAYGLVVAPQKQQQLKTLLTASKDCTDTELTDLFEELSRQLDPDNQQQYHISKTLKLRFTGQNHAIEVDYTTLQHSIETFKTIYQARYSAMPNRKIEIVSLHLEQATPAIDIAPQAEEEKTAPNSTIFNRDDLPVGISVNGPCTVKDSYATTYIEENWQVTKDAWGHLILTKD